jgi:hypothetical protein
VSRSPGAAGRVDRLGAVAATAALALVPGGCGGSGPASPGSSSSSPTGTGIASSTGSATGSATGPATATTHASSTHRRGRRAPVVRGPRVGARQGLHTGGTYLTVTVLRVLALTDTGSPVLPGTRQVGVELRIANQRGEAYDSTASGDLSLVLSAGESQPLDIRHGPCTTPLVDFESMIYAGDVRSGCVAFSVPRRARVLGVRFSPHSRSPGRLTWRTG